MPKIEVDQDKELWPGDRVELYFKAPGPDWMKAIEAALVESAMENRPDFQIICIDYWQPKRVILEVEVTRTNPAIVTVGLIVGAILATAGLSLAAGWMFEKALLLVEATPTKIGLAGLLIIAGLIIAGKIKGK